MFPILENRYLSKGLLFQKDFTGKLQSSRKVNPAPSFGVAAIIGFLILAVIVIFVRIKINKEKRMKALAQRAIRLGVNPTYIEETWKRRFIKSWSISNFFSI